MIPLTTLVVALQLLALIAVAFKIGPKYGLVYLASIPIQLFVVAELVSGHIVVASHLLWLIPAGTVLAVVVVVVRRNRRAEA
jgi:hypothetical protein